MQWCGCLHLNGPQSQPRFSSAGSACGALAVSLFLFIGKDLALGDKFLFDECTLWECFILTDYFYLFNVIFKIFIFYTEGVPFLKRKNELIKHPLLSSLLKCIAMGVGRACWDLSGQRTERWENEVSCIGHQQGWGWG